MTITVHRVALTVPSFIVMDVLEPSTCGAWTLLWKV